MFAAAGSAPNLINQFVVFASFLGTPTKYHKCRIPAVCLLVFNQTVDCVADYICCVILGVFCFHLHK